MYDDILGLSLKDNQKIEKKHFYLIVKRVFDIIISSIMLILLFPIFLIIGLLIKLDSQGPVFYKHKRIGKNGENFYLYKFRSMYSDSNERLEELLKNPEVKKEWETNFKLDNDPRITRIGKILRKTSIDELPQLINIFKGEMSLVGPRPIIEGEIDKYGFKKKKLLSATPGLTGWWACNGRSCTNYDDRIKLELYYVEHRSFKLDLKVILKTFVVVLRKNGAK